MFGRQRITGRLALVTGGARGIGRAIASALLEAGAPVAIADLDELAGRAAAEQLAHLGPEVRAWPLDVTDGEAFEELIARVEREQGPVSILVNNAGIMPVGPFLEQPPSHDQRQIEINVFGVIHGMRAVLPRMLARREGHIVNLASVAGRSGTPYAAVYSGAKHAVVGLTEAVRHEVRDRGVELSYVLPAFVDTELISGTGRPRWPAPLRPEDVAQAVVRRALERRRVEVYVPRLARLSKILPAVLPRPVYERIGVAFGLADMFAQIDPAGRARYVQRVFGVEPSAPGATGQG